jgi:hypothetical protein
MTKEEKYGITGGREGGRRQVMPLTSTKKVSEVR